MGVKSILSKPLASFISKKIIRETENPFYHQEKILKSIISVAAETEFGKEHNLREISSYEDFTKVVDITDYESYRSYIDRIAAGVKDVLWPGSPIFFAKTSGTTSGVKYIPITKQSIHNHIDSARNALLMYIYKTGKSAFTDKKMIFLQGSPELEFHGKIKTGRLSGIAAHYVPSYLQKNRLPSWKINCIEDWEEKVDKVVLETMNEDMALISGIPSWLRMYFEKLTEKSGKPVGELFPSFNLLVYGGVNFEPYRNIFNALIGRDIDVLELFPASEGFFAFQDEFPSRDMLLNINSGIFYEFIPLNSRSGQRVPLQDVKTSIDYSLIITSNAGLYAYEIGDVVQFTSLQPYRIKVTGRTSRYISAFGEHVISSEVENAVLYASSLSSAVISEFTVAPLMIGNSGKPCYEWLIEFEKIPDSMSKFASFLDEGLCLKNIYYKDLIGGKVLSGSQIVPLPKGSFSSYLQKKGLLGGQNKVPRLANDRDVANDLKAL